MVHLPAERFPGLLASDLEHGSLYALLQERYRTQITRAREAVEPVLLPAREAKLLGSPPRSLALMVEGTAFAADGTPVELSRTFVRGDRSRYFVDRVVIRSGASRAAEQSPAVAVG
jgi:GntR family transcriptional regulator